MINKYLHKRKKYHFQKPKRSYYFIPSTYDHIENFQNLVKYLVRLRNDGDINSNVFEGLVRQATACFVEDDIANRIDRVFSKNISLNNILGM